MLTSGFCHPKQTSEVKKKKKRKKKESEKIDKYSDICQDTDKAVEHEDDGDINNDCCLRIVLKCQEKRLGKFEISVSIKTIQTTALLKSAEKNSEEFWRPKALCCHSNFCEKLSV